MGQVGGPLKDTQEIGNLHPPLALEFFLSRLPYRSPSRKQGRGERGIIIIQKVIPVGADWNICQTCRVCKCLPTLCHIRVLYWNISVYWNMLRIMVKRV